MLSNEKGNKILHLLSAITEKYTNTIINQQRKTGTAESRTEHCIKFCRTELEMDPRLTGLMDQIQTAIELLYCAYLTEGHTIKGFRVKLDTLKGYINSMAHYVQLFTGRDIPLKPDKTFPPCMWKNHPLLEKNNQQHQRLERYP